MNPIQAKCLGREIKLCLDPDCRVVTFIARQESEHRVCPGCGNEAKTLTELRDKHRAGAPQ